MQTFHRILVLAGGVALVWLLAAFTPSFAAGRVGAAAATAATDPPPAAVVYLVRHAETDPDAGRDPVLTPAGVARAERLAAMFRDEPISAVFVTATKRSHATAAPTLDRHGLAVTEYAPMDFAALAGRIAADHAGGRVLIVAHSNTVAGILRALGGPATPELEHDEFDRLYVIAPDTVREPRVLRLRY